MKNLIFLVSLVTCAGSLQSQPYDQKLIAAVIMGESWNQGLEGMLAVGEVISTRAKIKRSNPVAVVSQRRAFSCLNRTNPGKLIQKYQHEPEYRSALAVAAMVCAAPDRLPGITKGATHFTRKEEKPTWAKGRQPVRIVKNHAFYRLKRF